MKKLLSILALLAIAGCSAAQPGGLPSDRAKSNPDPAPPAISTPGTPRPSSEATLSESGEASDPPLTPSSSVTASQDSPEGAVLSYLKALAEGGAAEVCKTVAPANVNRLESLGENCESVYGQSELPFLARELSDISFGDGSESDDGRGVKVMVRVAEASYYFTCVEEAGIWYVDPESYTMAR